jgi:hypothetical protein
VRLPRLTTDNANTQSWDDCGNCKDVVLIHQWCLHMWLADLEHLFLHDLEVEAVWVASDEEKNSFGDAFSRANGRGGRKDPIH